MTSRRSFATWPAESLKHRLKAAQRRVDSFVADLESGAAELPLRAGRIDWERVSLLVFGHKKGLFRTESKLRAPVEAFRKKQIKAAAAAAREAAPTVRVDDGAARNARTSARLRHKDRTVVGQTALNRIEAYLGKCRAGRATFPLHSDGTPNYTKLLKLSGCVQNALSAYDVRLRDLVKSYMDEAGLSTRIAPRLAYSATHLVYGRSGVPVNLDPTHYVILPWSTRRFAQCMKKFGSLLSARKTRALSAWTETMESWFRVRDAASFEEWLATVLAFPGVSTTKHSALPMTLLYHLRRHSILLPPLGLVAGTTPKPFRASKATAPAELFTEWEQAISTFDEANYSRSYRGLFLNVGPTNRLEDFPVAEYVESLSRLFQSAPNDDSRQVLFLRTALALATRVDDALLAMGASAEDRMAPLIETAARTAGWYRPKAAPAFSLHRHPVAQVWAAEFKTYVSTRAWKAPRNVMNTLTHVLDYLEGLDDPPLLSAPDLRARLMDGPTSLSRWLSGTKSDRTILNTLARLRQFFEYYVAQHPEFKIPIYKHEVPRQDRHWQSTRALIPRPLLDESKEICRTLAEHAFSGDAVLPDTFLNRERFENLLGCPVAVPGSGLRQMLTPPIPVLLYLLLTLPIRTIQARLLDSGEADEVIPVVDPGTGPVSSRIRWVENTGRLAIEDRRQGCIRLARDTSVMKDYVIFWINTNKTDARGVKQGSDFGYEIPWQNDDLISILLRLRDWQTSFNPVRALTSRAQLSEAALRPTEALARRMPRYTFLFRHPREHALAQWHEPVAYQRLGPFFLAVMEEIELRRKGTADEVSLIVDHRTRGGAPSSAIFSLHGLRVSGISAFAEAGVPAPIIAEFIAGHLTVLMTLYYQKYGPATVSRMLDEAEQRRFRASTLRELGNPKSVDDVRRAFVAENGNALQLAADTSSSIWAFKLDGICPNGQTRCNEGGALGKNGGYLPVPGGARNCALCRFWMTGPAFAAGQVISINALLYSLRERSQDLMTLHARRRTFPEGSIDYDASSHAIDSVDADINMMIRSLQARYRLSMASLQLADTKGMAGDGSLVTFGGAHELESSLREVSDLRLLDFVSRSVEVFPELGCQSAQLQRNLLIDQLLDREDFEALLVKLPFDVARRAGSAFGRVLEDLVGGEGIDEVASGTRGLRELGITKIEEAISVAAGVKLKLLPKPGAPTRSTITRPAKTKQLLGATRPKMDSPSGQQP